jgi:inner membrane protein
MPGFNCAPGERPARTRREAGIDPVCHTLFGAALSRTGLGRRTGLGAAALVIGANLPDVDGLAYLNGPAADLEWRRGWTHGILALLVLPFLLTGGLLLFRRVRDLPRKASTRPVYPGQVLLLSAIAVLSHPILDTLNTYGVRWLMPFSGTWFYGDSLFIVDPGLWLALALGIFYSRRRDKTHRPAPGRPARVAIAVTAGYVLLMTGSGAAARAMIRRDIESISGAPVDRTMAAPVMVNPLVRRFVVQQGEQYRVGRFSWLPDPHVSPSVETFERGPTSHPAVLAAAKTSLGRRFLLWARFPTFTVELRGPDQYLVHLVDLRYAERPGEEFGAVSIPVTLR